MIYKKTGIFSALLFSCLTSVSTQLMIGDKEAPAGATFSFSIKNNVMSPFNAFYVAADENIITSGKNYAIARLNSGTAIFEPLTPEKITLNNEADSNNPLFGAKNNALALLRPSGGTDLLIAVTEKEPAVVYLVQNTFNTKNMILVSTPPVHDAVGMQSSGVINCATNVLAYVFAAVKPALGNFGDQNSGIALLVRGNIDDKTVFGEVDAQTGKVVAMPKAFPLDKTSPLVSINSAELAAMNNAVSFHWDTVLQRLFIGLQTTSNGATNDGTRAVVVGKLIENGGLELFPIAPDSAFDTNNVQNIVGVRGANQTVSIYDIKTMYTSTGLSYLIVVGGNGTSQKSVFALPLVSSGDDTGTLAQKDDIPKNVFSNGDIQKLIARNITQSAVTQEQMTQSTDSAAIVGIGELAAGNITNIVIRDDTIYAFIGDEVAENSAAGMYSSQALFDVSGKIKGWTEWQRAGGTTRFIFEGALNTFGGTFIYATGESASTVNTILQTTWSNGNEQGLLPVTTYFDSIFSVHNGGIQSLQTFLPSTPGLNDISLMIAGGIGTLSLVQTGILENNIIIPTPSDEFTVTTYQDGIIDSFPETTIVTFAGGVVGSVGPVTAAEIGKNDTNGWLFIGGSDGLAVLTNADGSGWDIAREELGNRFDGFVPGMSFKTVGNYRFVKKIISEDNFLFIVTNDAIDRINLNRSNFSTNELDVITVATKESLRVITSKGTILDAIISQACAIIATTGGLVRIGDNKDVRTIMTAEEGDWTSLIIHETSGAPVMLLTVSTTDRSQDITRGSGGHFYVLTNNAGFNQSRINRFSVSSLEANEPMQSTTVMAFDDLFVKDVLSFFLNFGNYNSLFATDGGLYFASRNKNNVEAPRVVLTPFEPAPRVGTRNVGERSSTITINTADGTEINAFERSQASGSWIVAGDFGMQVLE